MAAQSLVVVCVQRSSDTIKRVIFIQKSKNFLIFYKRMIVNNAMRKILAIKKIGVVV